MSQPSSHLQPQSLTAAVLVIGNEILSGRTLDKNTQHIAQKLSERGIRIIEARVVPDIEEKIVATINELRAQVDYLFTTGGIGPTHDDITAQCVAKAVGAEFGRHPGAYKALEDYYGLEALTDARALMARMPLNATLVDNPVSGAPGFHVENIYTMAGVPRIMQAMLDNIVPTLGQGALMLSRTISSSLPESVVAEGLGQLQLKYPNIDIGSYPRFEAGNIGLSIVLRCVDEAPLEEAASAVSALVRALGSEPNCS